MAAQYTMRFIASLKDWASRIKRDVVAGTPELRSMFGCLPLVPLGIWLVLRLLEPEVLLESRVKAGELIVRPKSLAATVLIVGLWALCVVLFGYWLLATLATAS